ncbi:MAG: hypothetical protein UT48_C0037G0008 [Parcubacteria group bacterium GW2011_GWE2_39_37]|nr:MAG: hypothetical protein UT48_C0037G0008 [Parcubacteria group bacterium GW2011_GWE2_39_37]
MNPNFFRSKLFKISFFALTTVFLFSGLPKIINEVKMDVFAAGTGKVHVAQIALKIQTCQTTPACIGTCALCGGCGAYDQLQYAILFGQEARSELIRSCPSIGFKPMQGNGMCNVGEVIFGLAQDMTLSKITPADAMNFFCGKQ